MSGPLIVPAGAALDLEAATLEGVLQAVAGLLRDDVRISSWDDFVQSIGPKQIVELKGCGHGVCLAHGRDASVRHLALAAGRLHRDADPGLPRFVFVFAIPSAMAEEYLRAVGALARLCGEKDKMAALERAASPAELASALDDWLG